MTRLQRAKVHIDYENAVTQIQFRELSMIGNPVDQATNEATHPITLGELLRIASEACEDRLPIRAVESRPCKKAR